MVLFHSVLSDAFLLVSHVWTHLETNRLCILLTPRISESRCQRTETKSGLAQQWRFILATIGQWSAQRRPFSTDFKRPCHETDFDNLVRLCV